MKPILPLAFALALASSNVRGSDFPAPYNTERGDESRRLSAAETATKMQLPPGFKATVFAAEPDVQNPIAISWDSRGRLWVAENYTYAENARVFDLNLRDRILIFEDTDGDGKFDTRKVFSDELQMLTSIEVGHGGVYVMCPPQLLFIPDRDGNDAPDGAAEVLLDGFTASRELHHTFANGLRFGPDGWLYGRCGASSAGEIGRPGAPAGERIPLRGSMWRYHPQRKTVEVISSGTTNPWGHDWNEHGELFFINTVNGHLWHEMPGAHFMRPHTIDPNPRVYELIDQHADHYHFDVAGGWQRSRNGAANDLGGGHAHVGLMIYQGDNWPAEYRQRLFTLNLHGRRINQEILERNGSGYVGRHGMDFMIAADPWFRGLDLSCGPDGGVFALDWSDTGECHDVDGIHRASGRIYKIAYGDPKPPTFSDLAKLKSLELAKLHTHANEWFVRKARVELTARAAERENVQDAIRALRSLYNAENTIHKLRAFWTLFDLGALDETFLRAQLRKPDEHVRAWAVRFLSDAWPLDTVLSQRPGGRAEAAPSLEIISDFVRLAKSEPSGLVRLTLASTLQRLPAARRAELAEALLSHSEDAADHNLPLMIWYGLIPLGDSDPSALGRLAAKSAIPLTRRLITRRLSEDIEKNPAPLDALLMTAAESSPQFQADVLAGMSEGLAGWRKAKKPAAWDTLAAKASDAKNPGLRERARDLSVLFGDGRALDEVKKVALDTAAAMDARKVALQTLIDSRSPEARSVCEQLLPEQWINSVAARGLAAYNDAGAAAKLVRAYKQVHFSERPQLLSALVSRPEFAKALLQAVAEGRIARSDLSAYHARQIRSLNDPDLSRLLTTVWGELRESAGDKREAIARWKLSLTPEALAKADLAQGRAAFNLACAPCHTLYGEGGKVGPDLTGSGRDNLEYILENVVDPSAVVTADFRMTILLLNDGRTLNGVVAAKTDRTITLKTMTETVAIDRADIKEKRESELSLMPEGLLDSLSPEQVRDLVAYLMHKTQTPLPNNAATAK